MTGSVRTLGALVGTLAVLAGPARADDLGLVSAAPPEASSDSTEWVSTAASPNRSAV